MSFQNFYGNVDVVPCSGSILHSWGLLLLYRDLVRGYRRYSPWLPRSYVHSFSVYEALLKMRSSDKFSGVGIEEHRLWKH